MNALDVLLDALPAWVIVAGKGGVGKTTCAASLATRAAERNERTLLLSTDPARSLGEAIGVTLSASPAPVAPRPGLYAMQLDAAHAREAFLMKWRDTIVTIVDRGTYLDREEIAGLVDAAFPGADEAMALLSLLDLDTSGQWERVIIDTAPTGHTLRLLELPATIRALAALLDAMQDKHRFMVHALTHRYRSDAADEFIRELQGQVESIGARLRDASRTGVVLVTRDEPVVTAESARYLAALEALAMRVFALITNSVAQSAQRRTGESVVEASSKATAVGAQGLPDRNATETVSASQSARIARYWVPELQPPPYGLAGVTQWGKELRSGDRRTVSETKGWDARPDSHVTFIKGGAPARLLTRNLTIVGGKGGVGKTTVACALAIAVATDEQCVLLVSTDPAPSVGDALAIPVGDENVRVADVPGLFARQMDATAAFSSFRERYSSKIDDLFQSLVGRGLDAVHDRRIMRDLMALAPPGIDELYALVTLGELLEDQSFHSIIVDPAPTGHLLRLLEMPELALDWSHRLLRLMLKYKDVVSLGDAAGDVLAFSQRTRAVGEMLADGARTGLLVVALDEPLVRGETERLLTELRARSVPLLGVLWNRAARRSRPLPASLALPQFAAPVAIPAPRGIDAIRRWQAEWSTLPDRME